MSTKRPFEAKIRIRCGQVLLIVRSLPSQFENAYYHVTCRGKAGKEIFSIEADRSESLDLLGRSSDVYRRKSWHTWFRAIVGMDQREIGGLMGIDYSGVSVTRERLSVLQEKDPYLTAGMENVNKRIELSQE